MDIRWNTNFIRGLAESVLDRARVIRNGLVESKPKLKAKAKPVVKKANRKVKASLAVNSSKRKPVVGAVKRKTPSARKARV